MSSKNLSFNATLLTRRRALRLSLNEAAERAKVSRPTLSSLERGKGLRSSLDAVAEALGLRLDGADRLAAARERRGWSVVTAAARAGLSAPTVRLVEAGRGRVESMTTLAATVGIKLRLVEAGRYYGPIGVAHSSESVEWYTPAAVVAGILAATGLTRFDLDAASPVGGAELTHVPAAKRLTVADDGLSVEWHGDVWLNPPYGREISRWVAKCAAEAARGTRIVALLPASTDTDWWHDHVVGSMASAVPVRGRITFEGPGATGQPAPFRSAVVLWGWPPDVTHRVTALPRGWTRHVVPFDWFEQVALAA